MGGTGEHNLKGNKLDTEGQKVYALSHLWNIDLIQMQQYYETLLTLRSGHTQDG
jgi:hypothetical protein